jgi:hypothetical protein
VEFDQKEELREASHCTMHKYEAALADVVRRLCNGPEPMTVNLAREHAEKELELEDGFFSQGTWKAKSKQIIKDTIVSAGEGGEWGGTLLITHAPGEN